MQTILLLGILLIGAYFRFTGIDWAADHHLHPDERFMTMVASSISSTGSVSEYFDTSTSSLNPNNRGFGFYVYGTLPLFLVRWAGELVGQVGYSEIHLVGRFLSGLADLMTVLLVYLIAARLFRNSWLALLAALFSAMAVLQIQLSHYFTVDTFTNFFTFLAFYYAVRVMTDKYAERSNGNLLKFGPAVVPYLFFGAAFGLAMASKISAAPLAALLPAAALIVYSRLPAEQRERHLWVLARNLALAAIVSLVVFRVFQPYAFSGPGFFDVQINENWINSLRSLAQQSGGDVDFPPALQWARRPVTFAWENMVMWGLGLPLGLLAWAGFAWMGWRMLKGEWRPYALIWGWTLLYFVWQSMNFSRSMRYQLPVYPTLAMMAAWAIFVLWGQYGKRFAWRRVLAATLGVAVVGATFAWAAAFTQIYTRPITRIAASEWIFQNVPAALNLRIKTSDGVYNQPLATRLAADFSFNAPLIISFEAQYDAILGEVDFSFLRDAMGAGEVGSLLVLVSTDLELNQIVTNGLLTSDFGGSDDPRGNPQRVLFERPLQTTAGQRYFLTVLPDDPTRVFSAAGPVLLGYYTAHGTARQALPEPVETIRPGVPITVNFRARRSGELTEVFLPAALDWLAQPEIKTITLTLSGPGIEAESSLHGDFNAGGRLRGQDYTFTIDPAVHLEAGRDYHIRLALSEGQAVVALYGSRQALESSWDDPLPYGLEDYLVFDYYYGLHRTELNFEMYWDDNENKRQRFISNLDQADYLFISSGRQWGTTTRVPERYLLTTAYYRNLIGCPDERDVVWCYRVAEPGMFSGRLGFELVKTFTSHPQIGPLHFNTQFAEEAFTVYDHPKVMIFRKTDAYDPAQVRAILGAVDLSRVVHLTPRQASLSPASATDRTLLLPEDRLEVQRQGGTWSELFDRGALINRYPGLAAALWYVVITVLGWLMYPFVRLALGSLADRGYPLVRLTGMLALAYITWLGGSFGVPVTTGLMNGVAGVLLLANLGLALAQRDGLRAEWRERKRYFLTIELLTLFFFLFFLLIRLGNPDLWHPAKGGEKPMDFSYLNAIIKSTTFPPYDPWFAGGYINYYYFGFVMVGVVIKWLGIVPSIAYNIALAALFSMLAMAAFSFGWNLFSGKKQPRDDTNAEGEPPPILAGLPRQPLLAGIFSSVGLLILGNLGTVRMIWHGIQRLAANGSIDGANIFQRIIWTFQGLARLMSGENLPFGMGDWYWIPSRAIPGSPITEFPFFTFLYADLHAHLMALPLTALALIWALAVIQGRWQWTKLQFCAAFLLGGLAIGALRPTNTWDLPAFMAFGALAVIYAALRSENPLGGILVNTPVWTRRALSAVFSAALLVALAIALYLPYAYWYVQPFTSIGVLEVDERTPIWSYLTHWGLFLFVVFSWMFWETVDWMAKTPLSHARRYFQWLQVMVMAVVMATAALLLLRVEIAVLALPMAAWAAVLLFRPGQPDPKRVTLFLIGSGLFLTLMVEVVVLRGDITRMNTVFKFYLQAWTMLSLAAAASLVWLLPVVSKVWRPGWRNAWQTALLALVIGAALFPLLGGTDKIRDRMSAEAPLTLDGMTFMDYSTYHDFGQAIDLSEDYRAIIWMQENIAGSPVIVEGHVSEYRWGSRFTIYTGLPGVVGWNWHQRQQRGVVSSTWVTDRVAQIGEFYETTDMTITENFIRRYDVEYIIVGLYERAMYSALGLEKFEAWDGILWDEVYRDGGTVIYKVR